MQSTRYIAASRDIVSESFDGDIVVLDLGCGKYFSFTDAGCAIWEALSAGVPVGRLTEAASETSPNTIVDFAQKLVDHRLLIVRTEASDASISPEIAERLAAAKELPDVFVFDDLSDLFLADPIHNVEELAGWPVVKPA